MRKAEDRRREADQRGVERRGGLENERRDEKEAKIVVSTISCVGKRRA